MTRSFGYGERSISLASSTASNIVLITLSTMFELSNPLNEMQILFINILTDGTVRVGDQRFDNGFGAGSKR